MMKGLIAGALALTMSATAAGAVTFQLVAEIGGTAPGTGGATFSNFGGPPKINSAGEIVFLGDLTGAGVTSTNNSGIFTSSGLVIRKGDTAPGTSGAIYESFGSPMINDAGEIAFHGTVSGTGVTASNDTGMFTTSALVAREGDIAPGTGGATFSSFNASSGNALNNAGEIAFRSTLSGADVTSSNSRALFTSSALVAREGDVAPGTGGATYSDLSQNIALNDTGETVFYGRLTGTGVTASNDGGIFTSSALVARESDVAPGTGGAIYSSFLQRAALNNAGDVAFVSELQVGGTVTTSNNRGIFTSSTLVARSGDVAPGTGGAIFGGFNSRIGLNNAGEMAFIGSLTGAGVALNERSIFFVESTGALSLIVRSGDVIDFGGGDSRTISSVFFREGELNDRGDISFLARFTDGSQGIVVASAQGAPVVPLPAPMLMLLSGLAGLGVMARRRRAQA